MRGDYSDYQESDPTNPEDYLRGQIANQVGQGVPTAVPDPVTSPVYAPPETPAPPDTGGSAPDPAPYVPDRQTITDPSPAAPSPGPDSSSVGAGIPWNPGASAPSSSPPGYHWDAGMANFAPNAPTDPGAGAGSAGGYRGGGDQSILSLLQQGMSPQQAVQMFNQTNGRSTGNEAVYYNDTRGQTIGLPGGYAALTPSGWTWTVRTPEGPGAGAVQRPTTPGQTSFQPSIAAPSAGPSFGSISGGNAGGPQGVWNSDFVAQLRQLLMSRLAAASTPVDPNSATITAPLNAARDEATRASDKERTSLAENLYAQGGLNTDAIAQKVQQSGEKNAQGLSSLRATLITREMAQKQDELKSLLQMALQSGDAESAQAIQLQLAELTAQVQREGIGSDLAKYSAYLNALASNSVMN